MVDKKDLLVEIGTEELPPQALPKLSLAFEEQFVLQLDKHGLGYGTIERFATPRRLAVRVNGLDVAQTPRTTVRRGPALRAAFDTEGDPTKAAMGFARSCGVDVKNLTREETSKGAWLVHEHTDEGRETETLLSAMVEASLDALPIPKRMRWGDLDTEFVRPVHWVVLLFGDRPIETTVLGLIGEQYTRGHRFHHPEKITIPTPASYETLLRNPGRVEPDFDVRRERIRDQAEKAAATIGAIAVIDGSLLDEVTSLTEWPVAVIGTFDKKFLEVPAEVLIETMQKNQKYFPIVDRKNVLVSKFIAISNIESLDPNQVKKGNERVIRPRFKDAAFFWEQDRKKPLNTFVAELGKVVFQERLGTLREKTIRIAILAKHIGAQLDLDPETAECAAELSKCDLLTLMVGEFPTLQGIMGKYYAQAAGENTCVSEALEEQYLPRHAGDRLPKTKCGQALALADRIDNLVGIFAIGQRPSGAKDPYALRRASLAVLRIIIETPIEIDLKELLELSADALRTKIDAYGVTDDVYAYILERLRGYYEDKGIHRNTVEAVLAKPARNPVDIDRRILAVDRFREMPESASLAAADKRIRNILKKADIEIPETYNIDALQEPSEKNLAHEVQMIQGIIQPFLLKGDYTSALYKLATLKEKVDNFFNDVMIMCDDLTLRKNRIALLNTISNAFQDIADISRL